MDKKELELIGEIEKGVHSLLDEENLKLKNNPLPRGSAYLAHASTTLAYAKVLLFLQNFRKEKMAQSS